MHQSKLLFQLIVATVSLAILSGCSTVLEKTNMLSDEKLISQTSGALGYSPNQLTLVGRRTEGNNTYAELKAGDGKEFNCIINGGNMLTMGIVNPPMCAKKGEPINMNPLHR